MGRHVLVSCDKCGTTAPGTTDPNYVPTGWGLAEIRITEAVKADKTREVIVGALVCGPCAELIRQVIVTKVAPLGPPLGFGGES